MFVFSKSMWGNSFCFLNYEFLLCEGKRNDRQLRKMCLKRNLKAPNCNNKAKIFQISQSSSNPGSWHRWAALFNQKKLLKFEQKNLNRLHVGGKKEKKKKEREKGNKQQVAQQHTNTATGCSWTSATGHWGGLFTFISAQCAQYCWIMQLNVCSMNYLSGRVKHLFVYVTHWDWVLAFIAVHLLRGCLEAATTFFPDGALTVSFLSSDLTAWEMSVPSGSPCGRWEHIAIQYALYVKHHNTITPYTQPAWTQVVFRSGLVSLMVCLVKM